MKGVYRWRIKVILWLVMGTTVYARSFNICKNLNAAFSNLSLFQLDMKLQESAVVIKSVLGSWSGGVFPVILDLSWSRMYLECLCLGQT